MSRLLLLLLFTLFLFSCSLNKNIVNNSLNILPEIEQKYPIFYFGYGSNMNINRMNNRCKDGNFVDLGKVVLNNYEFYFYDRGYANVRYSNYKDVEGVLYRINKECLSKLDIAEGYPDIYQREEVFLDYKNKTIKSQIYLVNNDYSVGIPNDYYYNIVKEGAEDHFLSEEYIKYIDLMANR